MARHGSARRGSRQRRLMGVAAVAALLAGSGGAVMAFGTGNAQPTAQAYAAPPSATTAPAPATTSVTVTPTTTATPKTKQTKTPERTTRPPARSASRTAAPKPSQAAPKPSPRTTTDRATAAPRPAPKPVSASSSLASQVLALVNDERAKAGCRALTSSSALQRAAQGHSADMAANDYFSHDSRDGRTFSDRIRAAGYSGGAIAENIAAGQSSASAVMKSWMGSPGHRANILNCSYRHLGVGFAKGGSYGYYWTQDFGG